MEKEKMELTKYIKIYDDCCKPQQIGNFIKYLNNKVTFEDAAVIGTGEKDTVDKSIRNNGIWTPSENTLSEIHWLNFYTCIIKHNLFRYQTDLNMPTCSSGINKFSVLKYKEGGFYKPHVDHHAQASRNISTIFFLNDDYEGGSFCFKDPSNYEKTILEVKPKSARMIMWPSNFLYPHQANTVIKGVRFAIVAWII